MYNGTNSNHVIIGGTKNPEKSKRKVFVTILINQKRLKLVFNSSVLDVLGNLKLALAMSQNFKILKQNALKNIH